MEVVSTFIGSSGFDEEEFQWQHLETLSASFKKNLRQIIRVLDFKSHTDEFQLLEAALFIQTCFKEGKILRRVAKDEFPVCFMTNSLKKYLYTDEDEGIGS